MATYSDKSLGELKEYWEGVKQEAVKRLAYIDALLADTLLRAERIGVGKRASPKQDRRPGIPRDKASRRRKKKTIQQSLEELVLPKLEHPVLQADLHRRLNEEGVKSSRQAVNLAVNKLIALGKMAKGEAPEGSLGPYVYGRPDMFADEEAANYGGYPANS